MRNVKIEVLGENQEVYEGLTIKAGKKHYIISKSPINEEVMIFRCNSKGHCSSMANVWKGLTFEDAKEFLANNQP